MTQKSNTRTPATGLDQWILDFLLTGDCTPRIKAYIWNPHLHGCLCNPPIYGPLWESIRSRALPAWRKAHRDGTLPWAETQRERGL